MRVFVTGVNGQLGHDVMNELDRRGHEGIGSGTAAAYSGCMDGTSVTALPYIPLDITDPENVTEVIQGLRPDAVIHCAGWTAVDAAEDPANQSRVWQINVGGTQSIASVCRQIGCKLIYISTDYVFHGQGSSPWQPDSQAFDPVNYYGLTKLAGEMEVKRTLKRYFIVRIAWAFGTNGSNFVKTMLRLGRTHDTLRVVCDQFGTPTYTYDLARLLVDMMETEKFGCYHVTNEGGYISWYDFAKEILAQAGLSATVVPVTTAEYGLSKAARPFNSRLDRSKLVQAGLTPLPPWQDALRRYLGELDRKSSHEEKSRYHSKRPE